MEKVGGYLDYLALEEDARRYEDICIWLAAEADAARVAELKARSRKSP